MSVRRAGRSRVGVGVVAVVCALVMAACSSSSKSTSTSGNTGTTAGSGGSIIVSAAASLTGTFGTLGKSFEQAHPGSKVTFNFGSSAALVTQIQQGASADVFASASTKTMDQLVTNGDADGTPKAFAQNTLEIVVKPGNPLGIHSLADLTKAKTVALCASDAPCGSAADKALSSNHVTLSPTAVTRGADVKATLAEVTTGDADAAVVYVTDAKTIGSHGVAVPVSGAQNVITTYEIVQVKGSKNGTLAQQWIAYVLSPTGQAALQAAGFMPPPA